METRWKAIAGGMLESGWLVALATIPVYFNVQSVRVTDGEKATLLRTVALVMLPFLVVWLLEVRARLKIQAQDSFWRLPLIRPALLFVAVLAAATAASIAPRQSFFGSYLRMQGLYTWLCYLVVFLAILLLVRRPGQVDLAVDALILASFAPALYGILQHVGLDPITWNNLYAGRVRGTLGNPIFLSGFLIMVVPLTIERAWERARRLKSGEVAAPAGAGRRAALFSIGVYVLLLSVQLTALLFCASRGPFIGFAAAAGFFLLILVVRSRRRWLVRSICAIATLVILALMAWALTGGLVTALRWLQNAGLRAGNQASGGGTVAVRLLIWEGAGKLFSSNPVRAITGYGPETINYTFSRVYPPRLAHTERAFVLPDRCHNETFDSLLTTGVLGLCVEVSVLLALLALLLGQLGLIGGRSDRAVFLLASGFGGAAGWLVPYFALGSFQLSGVGMPAGLLVGMAGYLLFRAGWGAAFAEPQAGRYDPLLIGLFVGVIAHFIEIQFGIATITTRLCFWAFAGLAVAIVQQKADANADETTGGRPNLAGKAKSKRAETGRGTFSHMRPEVIIGALVGLILVVVIFDLSFPGHMSSALVVVCLGVWNLGAALAAERAGTGQAEDRGRFRLIRYPVASLSPSLLFAAIYLPWQNQSISDERINAENLRQSVIHLANGVAILYAFVFLMLGWMAYLLYESRSKAFTTTSGSWWKLASLIVLLMVCGVIVQDTNLDFSRADVVVKQASGYEAIGQWEAALVLRSQSLRLQPDERQYRSDMANALVGLAVVGNVPNLSQRLKLLQEARSYLLGLWQENKVAFDGAWGLARLYRIWASLETDTSQRTSLCLEAERYYGSAIELFPTNASIFNNWADFYLEQHSPARAFEKLEQSRRVDDGFYETYLLRGKARAQERSYALAFADYERALALAPDSAAARECRAAMLRELQQSEKTPGSIR
jgi:tetratricopeptide (TPR) repeat protein